MQLPSCCRIEAEDVRSADALRADGWREVEVLETWVRPFTNWEKLVTGVRVADPLDLLACQAIAVHAFKHSRLHADPNVPVDVADNFKMEWVRKAFEQTPNDCFVHVSQQTSKVDGFLICKPEANSIRIDLIAVDDARRQAGVATNLLGWALDCYPGRSCVFAGTQERNHEGRLFYQKRGFRVMKRQRTFHK